MAKASRSSRNSRRTAPGSKPRTRPTPKERRAAKRSAPTPKDNDLPTEEKIMLAAKKLFTQKGFAATRTRDIAKEAGINLALLNYYFRSKEKLFDIVMMDNFRQFIKGITFNLTNENISMEDKLRQFIGDYVDFLTRNPDLPMFILNEIRNNPSGIAKQFNEEVAPLRSHMFRQVQEAGRHGKITPIDPFHFMANIIGLTVFPFVARPLLQKVTGVSDEQFQAFMQERKELVPVWINAIMHSKK